MSLHVIQNFFKTTVSQIWETGTGVRYVAVKPTPSSGWLVLSPSNESLREIIFYTSTGSDSTGDYIVVSQRGIGGTTEQAHEIGEPVRMNITAEHIDEISDALDQIVAAGAQDASTATKGISKMSVAPASSTNPIAVGDNDPRVPTALILTSAGAGDSGKVAKLNASGKLDSSFVTSIAPIVKKYTSNTIGGSSTTRYDITKSGNTIRYTFDGTGTDPGINASSVPVGSGVAINGQNFTAANNGGFVVTASGTNYFEVTNANGVAENDKTIGTGYLRLAWVKPTGCLYVVVETQDGGSGGEHGYGGTSGTYSRKLVDVSAISYAYIIVGNAGGGAIYMIASTAPGASSFGTYVGNGVGDVIVPGGPGDTDHGTTNTTGGKGGSSPFGNGGARGSGATGYGAGGTGWSGDGYGGAGDGTTGVVIVTEHYI